MSTNVRETLADQAVAQSITVAAGVSPTLVFGRDTSRRAVTIVNQGTIPVWIAPTQTRDPGSGFYLPVGSGYIWTTAAACYAFTAAGNATDGLVCILAELGEVQ